MAREAPLFSVVIPTQGRPSVRDAVASVLEQSEPSFELIVVTDGDSGSTDHELADMSDSRIRMLSQPATGVCAARNLGVAHAVAPWVAFLDDDDRARPDWLATWAANLDVDVVTLTANLTYHDSTGTREVSCRLDPADTSADASYLLAGGFAVQRDLYLAVGGYDERLRYYENFELGLRLCDRLATGTAGRASHVDHAIGDIHVEAAPQRIDRYGSARGEAAALILERHAQRFAGKPGSDTGFLRILSRSKRLGRDRRGAVNAAFTACRHDWRDPKNWKVLAAAALPRLERPTKRILRAFARYRSHGGAS